MEDPKTPNPAGVRRVVLCSGKIYYDLSAARAESGRDDVALLRVEQLYPFPWADLRRELAAYGPDVEVAWVQEEPENMGAWTFVQPRLWKLVGRDRSVRYIGRAPGAGTATGSHTIHQMEQKHIVDEALG